MKLNIPKTKDLNVVAERELPFTGNAAYLPYEEGAFSSKYDAKAEEMRQHILNLPDTPPKTERVYYISYKGDNKNDGRSPETPWKDFYRIGETIPNSTVLFERGGLTVRNNEYLQQAQMPTYFYTYKDRCPIVPMLYRGIIGVKNKTDMENTVYFIDKSPKSVDFE